MKKRQSLIAFCTMLCLILLLCACQSEEGKALDEQILAIGEVTDNSLPDIEAAERAYNGLSDKEQKHLKNRQLLFDSRTKYSQLQADKVISIIDALGEVTLEMNEEITNAENAFAALLPDEQNLVSNIGRLQKAREDYSRLRADEVDVLIDTIGEVSKRSEKAIEVAETALSNLTEYEKSFVRGKETIIIARETYSRLVAKEVDDKIEAIGEVTLKSEGKIKQAESAFDELSPDQIAYVTMSEQLKSARSKFNLLKAEEADLLIDAIGDVTLESGDSIWEAEWAIKQLTSEQLLLVTKSETLENAKTLYESLLIAHVEELIDIAFEDTSRISEAENAYVGLSAERKQKVTNYEKLTEAKAKLVVSLIDAIGSVTLKSEEKIDAAETAYEALKADEKRMVTNYQVLLDAKEKLTELVVAEQERRKQELIGKMNVTEDRISGQTFYEHKSTPTYINTRSYVLPYITFFTGYSTASVIKIVYDYAGKDWVFFKKVIIVTDDYKYTRTFDYYDITRKTSYGSNLCEYVHDTADKDDIEMLRDIASSESVTIRFQGDSYYKDITMSSTDQKIIQETLELYDLLRGTGS